MKHTTIKHDNDKIVNGFTLEYNGNDEMSVNKWMYEMHENITTRTDIYNEKYIRKMETMLHMICEIETFYKTYYDTDIIIISHNQYDLTDIIIINGTTGEIIFIS